MAMRFAPLDYVNGRPTKNKNHLLWRVNKKIANPWINDWLRREQDLRDRREARRLTDMNTGVEMIAAERARQTEALGWTAERDDDLYPGGIQLALAGAWYAIPSFDRSELEERGCSLWPWDEGWWRPSTRTRELVKAGALIAAAIDARARQGLD